MSIQTIPGTEFPFPVIERKGPPVLHTDAERKQRRGLLAKIHVAKKQMLLNDGEYEMMLRSFKVATAADMTLTQLELFIKLLKHYGWKPQTANKSGKAAEQLSALRRRCVEAASRIENGDKRLAGLAMKICGTSQLSWCRDIKKLERLLAVLGKIIEGGDNAQHD